MSRLILASVVAILAGSPTVSAATETTVPAPEKVLGGIGVLASAPASWAFTLANLNCSPEGNAVVGGLSLVVGTATAAGSVWWLREVGTTRGEVVGGVILASGLLAVATGVRGIRQVASTRKHDERAVTFTPALVRDPTGGAATCVQMVVSF
jgi:hypothetical protein